MKRAILSTLALLLGGVLFVPAAQAACTADADCRLYSSNCGQCSCMALASGEADPFCRSSLTTCMPAACSGKKAICNTGTGECQVVCRPDKVCGSACCPLGSQCTAGACVLPDIYADGNRAAPAISTRTFQANACELTPYEGPCIGAPGKRRLLRFDTDTPNVGAGDLFLGDPADTPELFEYSPCHNHFHFKSYAKYELVDTRGKLVADGGKRSFCLEDLRRINGGANATYNCGFQGIQKGWADVYNRQLSCQHIDITCVPPGDYQLVINLNFDGLLGESDYQNNRTVVPYTIPAPTCTVDSDCKPFALTCDGRCECSVAMKECSTKTVCASRIRGCADPCKGLTAICGTNGRCALR